MLVDELVARDPLVGGNPPEFDLDTLVREILKVLDASLEVDLSGRHTGAYESLEGSLAVGEHYHATLGAVIVEELLRDDFERHLDGTELRG
ncbi:MAG TPA: hypothetical protein VGK01_11270, partial [Candidatus Angelobacter sp.]